MKLIRLPLFTVWVFCFQLSIAQVPPIINYQGHVTSVIYLYQRQ
jgi:hypothetical protein